MSFPGEGINQPSTYLGQRSEVSTVDQTPVFPFGHGLSYASPTWLGVTHSSGPWPTDGPCNS
ncbi:hypothetical protein DMH04_10770 [Kibdelosporangium aridum]|uniref:Uncharacterized protein n=1 Tax=Kibdelosporangium aridum TaxID=2030 RepID=A0A428ZHF8_KIBAR|nr:hypothetical protein DMH04_10770 [Kibdelosporangium aridum]